MARRRPEVLDVLVQSKRNKHQIDVVKMPGRMRFRTALAQMRGDHRPEVVHPAAQRQFQAASGSPRRSRKPRPEPRRSTLDDAAFGAASPVTPKFVSRSDPAAQLDRRT
jgi:hypothetical protein